MEELVFQNALHSSFDEFTIQDGNFIGIYPLSEITFDVLNNDNLSGDEFTKKNKLIQN